MIARALAERHADVQPPGDVVVLRPSAASAARNSMRIRSVWSTSDPADGRERDAVARAHEQRRARGPLERGQLLRDSRSRVAERAPGRGDRALGSHGAQHDQLLHVQHGVSNANAWLYQRYPNYLRTNAHRGVNCVGMDAIADRAAADPDLRRARRRAVRGRRPRAARGAAAGRRRPRRGRRACTAATATPSCCCSAATGERFDAVRDAARARRRGRRVLHDRRRQLPGRRQPSARARARTGTPPTRPSTSGATTASSPFQRIPTFAAKQFKHWSIGDRHFLGLAQGVRARRSRGRQPPSLVFEWDGDALRRVPAHPIARGPTTGTPFRSAAQCSSPTPSTSGRACSTAGTASGSCRTRSCSRARAGRSPSFRRDGGTIWWSPGCPSRRGCCAGADGRFETIQELRGSRRARAGGRRGGRAAVAHPRELHPRHAGRPAARR